MKRFGITALTLLLAACVTAIPPSQGIYSGNMAYERGDYVRAKDSFTSALQIAKQQNWNPHIASAKYGLGRSHGQLCEFDAGQKYLLEAANLESEISGGRGIHLSQDYFELARLYYDYGKFKEAVPFFQKATSLAEEVGVLSSDPIGYANVLQDYAIALSKLGDVNSAAVIERKITDLRQKNVGKNAEFKIVRFNPKCVSSIAVQQVLPRTARP